MTHNLFYRKTLLRNLHPYLNSYPELRGLHGYSAGNHLGNGELKEEKRSNLHHQSMKQQPDGFLAWQMKVLPWFGDANSQMGIGNRVPQLSN